MMELGKVLDALYASEINATVNSEWDNGWWVGLGDQLNGYVAETFVKNTSEAAKWLDATVRRMYPESVYAGGNGYHIPLGSIKAQDNGSKPRKEHAA